MNGDIDIYFSFMASLEDYEYSATLLILLSDEIDSELQIQLHPSGGLTIDITDEDTDVLNVDNLDMAASHEIDIKTLDQGKQLIVKLDCKHLSLFHNGGLNLRRNRVQLS